ncbi:MAG TPA: phage holin family protein [Chitinophagaceae bacterium]|nr:phage holin family protein [Chitinophagaceae bacterium]
MEAQNIKEDAKDILNHTGDYLETLYKLNVVRATKKASDIASGVVNSVLLFFFSLCILLFLSIAAAWWLGVVFNSPALGFLSVAGFYLLLVIILISLRKNVISPFIKNSLIRKVYEEKNKVIR